MAFLTPEQITYIVGGLITLFLLLLTGFGLWVKAKFAALAHKATGDAESDTITRRALALKEMMEVDGMKFVFKTAEQGMATAQRLLEVERSLLDAQKREKDYQVREKDYQERLEAITAEVLLVRHENVRLQNKIVELETDNARLRSQYGVSN